MREVELSSSASSSISITTVRMSPTRPARWSLKKAREPWRHSEAGWRRSLIGSGIGRLTGW